LRFEKVHVSDDKIKSILLDRVLTRNSPLDFIAAHTSEISSAFRGLVTKADNLTRRDFLTVVGLGGYATAAMPIGFLGPRIVNLGRAIALYYGGYTWKIEPSLFGHNSSVKWQRDGEDFVIELKDAILPGTDLRVGFVAKLFEASADWHIRLHIPGINFESSAVLAPWLSGKTPLHSTSRLVDFRLGGGTVVFRKGLSGIALDPSFAFLFTGEQIELKLAAPAACTGTQILVRPQEGAPESFRAIFEKDSASPSTIFSLLSPRSHASLTFGSSNSDLGIGFEPGSVLGFSGEAFDSISGAESIALLEGNGVLGVSCRESPNRKRPTVTLDHASFLLSSGRKETDVAFAGKVSRTPHDLDCGTWCATIAGDESTPFYSRFKPGKSEPVRLRATLHHVTLPVEDADIAHIDVPNHPIDIWLGPISPKGGAGVVQNLRDNQRSASSALFLGKDQSAILGLDGVTLNIKRSIDLFNLSFGFEGFEIRIRHGVPMLSRVRSGKHKAPSGPPDNKGKESDKCQKKKLVTAKGWKPAKLAVHFPSQHIAEQWFPYQDPSTMKVDDPRSSKEVTDVSKLKLPMTSLSRMSKASRIVFGLHDKVNTPKWLQRKISIDSLTQWDDLSLLVNRRALGPNKTLEDQLCIPGINKDMRFDEVFEKVALTLTPPDPFETALEMSGRLIFSPSEEAKWQMRKGPVTPDNALLWHTRLNEDGRKSVRAIWSDWIIPGKFPDAQQFKLLDDTRNVDPESKDKKELDLVLRPEHHWEIVAQTSLYGLIALRRLEDPDKKTVADEAINKLPRSRVVRPSLPYESIRLLEDDRYKNQDLGFAIVEPFDKADMILTSMGGSLAAEWNGEPLTIPTTPEKDPRTLLDSFSLERFVYYSQLGRDVHIETFEKGYLLPLGIRASYVELTERRFFPHPKYRYPVCYPVQRTFIVIRHPEKPLPGINQPFKSRDFPADKITMLTRTTPDLISAVQKPKNRAEQKGSDDVTILQNGRLVVEGLPQDNRFIVFWPRITEGSPGTSGDVEFKWTLDSDNTPIVSNLLFVSNSVKALAKPMAQIVDYYRKWGDTSSAESPWPTLRTARVFGTRRRYAPSENDGDTSFDTDSWLLSTRGPLLPDGNTGALKEAFIIDGRMEGADQAPFYPVVEKAKITIQTLDRLVGTPQGLIDVRFNRSYIDAGFDEQINKGHIYLEVLHPEIALSVNNNGGASGGLARPNSVVAAISRKVGLVGGQSPKSSSPDTTRNDSFMPPSSGVRSPYDFAAALSGTFSPESFFSEDAMLLGLVKLKTIINLTGIGTSISNAPKLLEQIGYGPVGATVEAEVVKFLRDIFLALEPKLSAGLQGVEEQIDHFIRDKQKDLSFQRLYPTLSSVIAEFRSSLNLVSEKLKSADVHLSDLASDVANVAVKGRALLGEVEKTVRDPVPELIEVEIQHLTKDWNDLTTTSSAWFANVGPLLDNSIRSQLLQGLCSASASLGLNPVLFGPTSDGKCDSLVADPTLWLDRSSDSFFSTMFSGPLLTALLSLEHLNIDPQRQLSLLTARLSSGLPELLKTIDVEINGDNLIFSVPTDVYNQLAAVLVANVSNIIGPKLATLSRTPTPEQFAAFVNDTRTEFVKGKAAMLSEIAGLKGQFKVIRPGVFNEALGRFAKKVADGVVHNAEEQLQAAVDRLQQMSDISNELASSEPLSRTLQQTIMALRSTTEFMLVNKKGVSLSKWCEVPSTADTAQVVAFADTFARGLMGTKVPDAQIVRQLANIVTGLTILSKDRLDLVELLNSLRGDFLSYMDDLAATLNDLTKERSALGDLRGKFESGSLKDLCATTATFLEPVRTILQLRIKALRQLASLSSSLNAIRSTLNDDQGSPQLGKLDTIVQSFGEWLSSLTSIGKVSVDSSEWDFVKSKARMLASKLDSFKAFSGRLKQTTDSIETEATSLTKQLKLLKTHNDALLLSTLAERVSVYASRFDKELAALSLQSIVFPVQTAQNIASQASQVLGLCAKSFKQIDLQAAQLIDQIVARLQSNKVLVLFINPAVLDQLSSSSKELQDEAKYLLAIENLAGQSEEQIGAVQLLIDHRWNAKPAKPPAMAQLITVAGNLVEDLLRGNLSGFASDAIIRPLLNSLASQMRDLLARIVPTRTDLKYSWKTQLGSNEFFSMVPSTKDDFTIDSHVHVDFVSGERSVGVVSKIAAFQIELLKLVTIKFRGAKFEAANGSESHFSADFDTVELNQELKFLQALQNIMSPESGSGPYLRIQPSYVEAGYRFDIGVIQVASLQFINISLNVFAHLPLQTSAGQSSSAIIGFSFGSREKPFLISQPPYGGGGMAELMFHDGKLDVVLSFSFGAVLAFKFGPLTGHGRITSTFLWATTGEGQIQVSFEAVGEGNIGCFGITVMLQVLLRRDKREGGESKLYGEASYSFSFKVGFFSISFSFKVSYEMDGGTKSSNSTQVSRSDHAVLSVPNTEPVYASLEGGNRDGTGELLLVNATDNPADCHLIRPRSHRQPARFTLKAPMKATAWKKYRNRQSFELL
jgi:hypothetical protein